MELKAQIDTLQKDVAQLTEIMKEKALAAQNSEVLVLSEKLAAANKELAERKVQFSVKNSGSDFDKKAVQTRLDELFIAKQLCHDVKTGVFDEAAFGRIKAQPVYADAIKAAATFDTVFADTTTATGTGADWIPKGFSSQLQSEIFLALEVAGLFGRIAMPAADYTLPFNPTRMIARAGSEGGSVTKVKGATGSLNFKAAKIMSIVEMTDEFEMDSLVPALNFLRQQLIDGFALAQETMCLNGDKTLPSLSIYSAAPGADAEDCRRLVDGIRSDGMANTAKVTGLGGAAITEALIRAVRTAMGKYGKSPSDLSLIVNMADYNKMLAFSNFQTLFSYGAGATLLKGELGRFDGIPIIVSELLPKAGVATDAPDALGGLNASGIWDNTTKTMGTAVMVNKNGYLWGDRKEFTLELWRNPLSQTTNLIGAQRLDFEKVAAAGATMTGVLYNYVN